MTLSTALKSCRRWVVPNQLLQPTGQAKFGFSGFIVQLA